MAGRGAALLLLLLSLATTATRASTPWPHSLAPSIDAAGLGESKKYEGSSEYVEMRYHMGPVLTANITVHPIWYGSWSPPQKRILRDFLRSISPPTAVPEPSVGSWWRTVRLYTDQTGSNVSHTVLVGQEKSDRRCSEGKYLTRLSIQSVIRRAVTARTDPLPVNARGGIYLVLTGAEVDVENFCGGACGFHYFTYPAIVGYALPYAWVGNSAGRCPGTCAWPFAAPEFPGAPKGAAVELPPNGDVGVDGMVSVVGHELAEMASNPLVNAWYAGGDPSFPQEIADLCEGIYGTGGGGAYAGQLLVDGRSGAVYNVNAVDRRRFLVQWVWNPVVSYCFGPNAMDQ